MAYSTQADVQVACGGAKRLLDLADWNNAGTLADAGVIAVIAAAIDEADALINSFAQKRYATPIAAPTIDVVKLSARHATRVLRRNRGMQLVSDENDEKNDRAWLKMLADGDVFLASDTQPTKSSATVDQVGERSWGKTVSRKRLNGSWS